MDYIPYTPENEGEFLTQIGQWIDGNEYTRCIQALNAIPEEWRNYRVTYALVCALENYAIIGDHDEGTPIYQGFIALRRAIDLLESVREEGQDKPEWNMSMAYAYQYCDDAEKALPYAQRWAELDPEDEDAPAVICECQEEIEKRVDTASEDECAVDYTGKFIGSVLLSKDEWDKEEFISDMKEKWGIVDEKPDEDNEDDENSDDVVVMKVGGMKLFVILFHSHIPDNEAERNAGHNYMWQEAVDVAKAHKGYIIVAVLSEEEKLLEQGKLYTKALAVCCKQKYATGVYTSGVVFEPRFYEGFANMMKEDELPIFNWIWFGLYRSEGGLSGYTYGMNTFGKEEIEVLNVDVNPGELRDFLAGIAAYVLENDVTLKDGETIGLFADDKYTITRSPGVGLPKRQMTLKISYLDEVIGEK